MREKSSPFGQRRPDQQEKHLIKTRYFLAFEGEKTEKLYFDGFKEEIDTKLIEIIYLDSLYPRQKGHSHPKQVLEQVKKRGYNKRDKDEACMIVDRDPMSFTEEQYTKIVSECENSEIQFYVTNPRFEFWLLLHFFSRDQLDIKEICAPHEPQKEHYIEKCLHQHYPHFNKSRYSFTPFKNKVQTAIENERAFYEDPDQMKDKDNIGCNIGILLTKLMN